MKKNYCFSNIKNINICALEENIIIEIIDKL